jgi:hypothetical protein
MGLDVGERLVKVGGSDAVIVRSFSRGPEGCPRREGRSEVI